jgi:hypothetical protein
MTFVIHFGFPEFVQELRNGSTVYSGVYSVKESPNGIVLLTTDGGLQQGTIHAVQMSIKGTQDGLTLAIEAAAPIEAFLESKGITVRDGVLLTDGLQDALRYWGTPFTYTLDDILELLEQGKEVTLR